MLAWLRSELALLEKAPSAFRAAKLAEWKNDPDFAIVRDRREDLPEPEREAWRRFWAAVDESLASARQSPR